jgi:CubicO group peptidase (beta-lactamase class C family)
MIELKLTSSRSILSALLLSIFLLGVRQSVAAELSQSQISEIGAIVTTAMQKAPYPAVVVVVNQGGEDLYAAAQGFADLENQVPATLNSVFAIGSVTKSFTALATLQLVEQGILSLDDQVSSILPDYRGPAAKVTIRQLLTHTSGIPNYLNEIPELRGTLERRELTREQMVGYFAPVPLMFTPGTRWSYSNSGYFLLGIIIEKVSGLDYYQYLQKNIFEPFGLDSVYSGDDSVLVPHRARGYRFSAGLYQNAPPWHYLAPFSAGSLLSDANDLITYRRTVFHSAKVSKELLYLVTSTSNLEDGTAIQYTLGALISSDFHGHQKYSHSGEIYGYFSNHAYYPDEDLTIVILANNKGTSPSPIWMERKIARIVMQIPQPEVVELSLSQATLELYAGDYLVSPVLFGPEKYGFVAQDGQLFLRFGGNESDTSVIPLLAQGNGCFVMADDDEWAFRFKPVDSQSLEFNMQVRDATVTGRRMSNLP